MEIVSVIIVNFNGRKFIEPCLNGLSHQTLQPFSIIVVDNGSKDGSPELIARDYPNVKLIDLPDNFGFCAANNIGIRSTDTEYIALLNNDAIPHPFWLQNLIMGMQSNPEAGFAASKMLYHDHPETIDRAGDGYTRAGAGLLRGRGESADGHQKKKMIFGASAGAACYRTSMLKDIGLFDEDFFLLYEDVDLSFRAQLKGYQCLYVPEAIVYHMASKSIGYDSALSVYYSHRNLEWVYIQNMPGSLIRKTVFLHFFYDLIAFLFFLFNGRAKAFLMGKWDALRGLRKALKKREAVQKNIKTTPDAIWKLMDKETFYTRWTRRLK